MVTSVHLARVGVRSAGRLLRRGLTADGLVYAETAALAPLSPHLLPRPAVGSVGVVAAWEDDQALDRFRAGVDPLADGYFARLQPVRAYGRWPELGDLPPAGDPGDEAPAAVLTLGRLRTRRAPAFLRASAKAEAEILRSSALVLSTGMGRPGLVVTYSVWEDVGAMRAAVERGGHAAALAANAARPFHAASAFIRYRIREQVGSWPA